MQTAQKRAKAGGEAHQSLACNANGSMRQHAAARGSTRQHAAARGSTRQHAENSGPALLCWITYLTPFTESPCARKAFEGCIGSFGVDANASSDFRSKMQTSPV